LVDQGKEVHRDQEKKKSPAPLGSQEQRKRIDTGKEPKQPEKRRTKKESGHLQTSTAECSKKKKKTFLGRRKSKTPEDAKTTNGREEMWHGKGKLGGVRGQEKKPGGGGGRRVEKELGGFFFRKHS